MKNTISRKKHPLSLIALLLPCAVFFAGCSGDTSSNPSAITPIGAPTNCLTIKPPSLVKLADGNYKLVDEIDNCGGKSAGPLKVTVQINTVTTNLLGSSTIPANGKIVYNTSTGDTNKEIHLSPSSSSSVPVIILATINSSLQGEWDGEVKLPS